MSKFFIDTADVKYIREYAKSIPPCVIDEQLVGITTNPSAFNKLGKHRLRDWVAGAKELSDLLVELSPNRIKELHIQLPNSATSRFDAVRFRNIMLATCGDLVKLYIKSPPFNDHKTYGFPTNITGLADGGLAASLNSQNVDYVSLIPGRMEQVGIKASSHMRYASQYGTAKVIAGSMRTVEGLVESIKCGCIPTIGTTVLDLIKSDLSVLALDRIHELFTTEYPTSVNDCLSTKFFQQMDDFGAICYSDLLKLRW